MHGPDCSWWCNPGNCSCALLTVFAQSNSMTMRRKKKMKAWTSDLFGLSLVRLFALLFFQAHAQGKRKTESRTFLSI